MASNKYSIKQFVLPPSVWTSITTSIRCNAISLNGTEDILLRSDDADATTEDDLPAYMQESLIGLMPAHGRNHSDTPPKFDANEHVLYAKPAGTSTITAVVKCLY